jgi:Ca2+-binding EF-hand superfamily protein
MEELLNQVQKAFPKATRKQLEEFIYPLHEEFVTKYPRGMDFERFLYESDIKDKQIGKIIFRAIDLNRDGTINAAEWVNYCAIEQSEDPQQHLDFQFRAYDVNGDGYILLEELVAMIKILTKHGDIDLRQIYPQTKSKWAHGNSTPEELADNTILLCDSNHDHKIDHEEFACVSKHIIEYAQHRQAALEMERRHLENTKPQHYNNNNAFKHSNNKNAQNLQKQNNNLAQSNQGNLARSSSQTVNLNKSNEGLARSGAGNQSLRESQVVNNNNNDTPNLARSGKRRE